MRESNISEIVQFSQMSASRKDSSEDSSYVENQVQKIKKNENEEMNFSAINNSTFSENKSLKSNNEDNSKIINNQESSDDNNNKININKDINYKKSQIGNKINDMIIESDKMNKLYLRKDKEKTEQKGYTVYEISKYSENKKQILCYRRYDNFYKFYEALKIRYPHYIFPELSQKNFMTKVYDDSIFLEQRRKELEFFLNEIYSHEIIGKGEETKKFINDINFDKQYFDSLLKRFNYPEISEKIKENKGIISKGMEKVSDFYNYFVGNKNQKDNEREETKKIFEKTQNLEKNLEKFKNSLEEIKNIHKSFTEEYQEKKFITDNLLYLKDEEINEKNIDKEKFNDLIELRQNYNHENSKIFLKNFEENIIEPLNFDILYLNGEQKAIERYNKFLKKYEDIANYKTQESDNKKIILEKDNIKKDLKDYETNLLKDVENIEEKINKDYEKIINILIISLKDSTEEFISLFQNSNFIKE